MHLNDEKKHSHIEKGDERDNVTQWLFKWIPYSFIRFILLGKLVNHLQSIGQHQPGSKPCTEDSEKNTNPERMNEIRTWASFPIWTQSFLFPRPMAHRGWALFVLKSDGRGRRVLLQASYIVVVTGIVSAFDSLNGLTVSSSPVKPLLHIQIIMYNIEKSWIKSQ